MIKNKLTPSKNLLVNRFEYPGLQRVTNSEGKREYTDGTCASVPSVTTVLDKTADKSHLIKWRQRVGEQEAARITKEAAGLGTLLHDSLEKYLLGETVEFGSNLVHNLAARMAEQIIDNGISNIDEIWGCEVGLVAQDLYAGTADCIGVYKGKPAVIDFKNSKKIKKREWIEDYFLQCALYSQAHNEMFGTDIQQLVILMADREGNFGEFIATGDEYEHYLKKANLRLAKYYELDL